MKKRILAMLLCVCMLVPFMATAAGQVVAEETSGKSFIITELNGRVSAVLDLGSVGGSGGLLITSPDFKFSAIDVSGANGAYKYEDVAIQFDTYLQGTDSFVQYMTSGKLNGQLEATSSGSCDVEEIALRSGKALAFNPGGWLRVTIPLSNLGVSIGEFDKTSFNFIRLYLEGGGAAYEGATGTFKAVNWCLVDLSVPVEERPTELDRPLGDGTFRADPPVFEKMEITPGFDNRVDVYAGYNLKTYLADHPDISVYNNAGQKDYSPVINSLLEALGEAGGGALFIPAGIWECRTEINMPPGTTIVGEWANPDEDPDVRGTVISVYCGANMTNGAPFISMMQHCKVNNVSFWYPEQTVDGSIQYPPTIDTYQYCFVENVTFVNSYFAIQQQRGANCPNAWNIYGTPLNIGVDFDMVVDISRIQEIHFSAEYWINSGLPGAPTTDEEIQALEDQLYNYAIGITLRRIDWSYVTYSDIIGYNIGLLFAQSIEGNFPNGQCVGLNFVNCKYGHFSYGASDSTESLLGITMKNCEYGIYTTGEQNGAVQYYDADIQATKYAVYQDSAYTKLTLMASTIRGGRVYTKNGSNIFINNKFLTAAPQLELDYGTVAAIVLGNKNAYGDEIVYENPGRCTMSYDAKAVKLDAYTEMTREEAYGKTPAPESEAYIIPTDIDRTGKTDVTEKIQAYLTQLGATGGTLFLQPGTYRIDGTLTVPTGVELRGAADYASIPKAVNTVFMVRTPIEAGKDEYTSTATITMAPNSGVRGIIFNYPDQHSTYRVTETVVDPVQSAELGVEVKVDYYEFDFIPYPYLIRGTGSDIYVVNISVRNGWNGIDFVTNRCDNHYVDYLAGHFLNRGIVIGNGSTGGYIRNFQFNYNSLFQCLSEVWSGFGGQPSTPALVSAFHQPMQAQFNNNSIILQLGHVEDQLVYNCFNYASYIGVHLVEEDGRSADARIFGHGVDYGTVSVKIEAAENVEFTNMQLTAFNQCGDNGNTKRWAVDQSKEPIYDIWLTDTFEGEITVTNFTEWAPTPTSGVRVDSGTLNMYNAQFSHTKSHLFELNGDGKLNIVGFGSPRLDNPPLVDNDPANLYITAGFYRSEPSAQAGVGAFQHVYERKYRYSVPTNATFTDDSEIVLVESFDAYDLANDTRYQVDDNRFATLRRGAIRARLTASKLAMGIKTGQNKHEEKPFALESGKKNDLYRLEWRISVDEMRDTDDSEIYLYLSNADTKNQVVFTIKRDGTVCDQNGKSFGKINFGTYYRLAVEVDARNANNKTVTVYLLNDDSRLLAKGATSKLKDTFQGANTVTGFWLAAMAMPGDAPETETDMYLDYFYIIRSEKSTIGRNVDPNSVLIGDVDNSGKVDSTDARLVLQYAVKKIDSLPAGDAADVNSDGKVDSTDARLILQYAVQKIDSFI